MIESTVNKVSYTVQNNPVFPFPIRFFEPEDIHCYLLDANDVSTELVQGTDFSVESKADYDTGANITLLFAPDGQMPDGLPVGAKLTIVRELGMTQEVNLPEYGKIPSVALEKQLDKLTMISQQLRESLGRALLVSHGSDTDDDALRAALKTLAENAEDWAAETEENATAAEGFATAAGGFATDAGGFATAAQGFRNTAGTHATAAGLSATSAQGFASSAQSSATAAEGFAANVLSSAAAAQSSAETAKTWAQYAEDHSNVVAHNKAWDSHISYINVADCPVPGVNENDFVLDIPEVAISTFGDLGSGTTKASGGVLAPNGKIYCMPAGGNNGLVIDTAARTVEVLNYGLSSGVIVSGSLAPNGKIYMPYMDSSVVEFDPKTETPSILQAMGATECTGGVLAPNGKIYCSPVGAHSNMLEINPATGTIDTFVIADDTSFADRRWNSVLAPNGNIYYIPQRGSHILVLDPVTRSTYTIELPDSTSLQRWRGGTLAPNGKIYCIPSSEAAIMIIDPATDTLSYIDVTGVGIPSGFGGASGQWAGGVLAPNGKIYCVPSYASGVLEIDPATDTTRCLGTLDASAGQWVGGVLAPNGKIYCTPYYSPTVLEISNIDSPKRHTWAMLPHFNGYSGTF